MCLGLRQVLPGNLESWREMGLDTHRRRSAPVLTVLRHRASWRRDFMSEAIIALRRQMLVCPKFRFGSES